MKKILAVAIMMTASFGTQAAPIAGFSNVNSLGGGVFRFIFDTVPADIVNTDGLTFSGSGSPLLTVTGSGDVIQDTVGSDPLTAHGGLGVNGGAGGDNIASGEWLSFSLGGAMFDIVDFTLNGNHSPSASGDFTYGRQSSNIGALANFNDSSDGVTRYFADGSVGSNDDFYTLGITEFFITSRAINFGNYNNAAWSGYVESITIRTAQVPEPSVIALLAAGLVGLGFARRRKA